MVDAVTHVHGDKLGMSHDDELLMHGTRLGSQCVDATITVSAEGATTANTRDITIQLLKADGTDVDEATAVKVHMFADAAMAAFVTTGGSTGIDVGTDGALLDVVAKKSFIAISETDGDIDLEWLDTGTEAAYLGLELPNGRIIISDALTNA